MRHYIAKSEEGERCVIFYLELQGSLDHCLQGTFAMAIDYVYGCQYRRRLECILISKEEHADVTCV